MHFCARLQTGHPSWPLHFFFPLQHREEDVTETDWPLAGPYIVLMAWLTYFPWGWTEIEEGWGRGGQGWGWVTPLMICWQSDQSEWRLVFFFNTGSVTDYMFRVDRKCVKHYGTCYDVTVCDDISGGVIGKNYITVKMTSLLFCMWSKRRIVAIYIHSFLLYVHLLRVFLKHSENQPNAPQQHFTDNITVFSFFSSFFKKENTVILSPLYCYIVSEVDYSI